MLRSLSIKKFVYYGTEISRNICEATVQCQTISSSAICRMDFNNEKKEVKKKTPKIPKVTLIHLDKSVTTTSLEEAKSFAKRRNLLLVKMVFSNKTSERDVYRLFSAVEGMHEAMSEYNIKPDQPNRRKKDIKLFNIKPKINDHDLDVKINNVNKLLSKNQNIKFMIFNFKIGEKLIEHIKKKVKGILVKEEKCGSNISLVYHPFVNYEIKSVEEKV